MKDNKLFIKSDDSYTDRWLHETEQFIKEKNWNINLPSEREFKNGYGIVTDKEDTAYSIDELINLLNYLHNKYYYMKDVIKELESDNEYKKRTIIKREKQREKFEERIIGLIDCKIAEYDGVNHSIVNILLEFKKELGL